MATEQLSGPPWLAPRYVLALLPGRGGSGGALPDRELALDGLRVDPGQLAEYAKVCGFGMDGTVPVTYPQVLALGAQLKLMTEPGFPLRLPGLVHLRQRVHQRRPITLHEPLDLRVRAADLRGHPKGAQVDLVARASVAGEPVWEGRSTYLARGARAPEPVSAGPDEPEPEEVPGPLSARWRLGGDIGRRYAAVSGDVNPIHLHPLTARLFGFPGAIAHGMWSAARCVATLGGRLPEAYDLDVAFRKPIVLPTTVELHTARLDGGWVLTLRGADADRVHLVMAVRPSDHTG
jgi:acyl dehydratase